MPIIILDKEIDLNEGKTVLVEIEIVGVYESQYGADLDGKRGIGKWFVESHKYKVMNEEELGEEEIVELEEKIDDLVHEEEIDWDAAIEGEYEPKDYL